MVSRTKEEPDSHLERSSSGIFRAIQIHAGDSSGSFTLQSMKKRPDEDYKEYADRWKNVASMVRPPLTSREENSMFMDTLPSPYYDMLIVNTFVEFGDLMYYVGRIEDGIKRGRIMDTGATTKGNVLNKHVEEPSRRKFEPMEESVGNLFHSRTLCTQVPLIRYFSPQKFAREYNQGSDSGYYQSKKKKRTRVYHPLPMFYTELLPILIQNYGISAIPARPGRPHIQKSMMSMLSVNTMKELGGTT